jgi:putative spermidine/putrescine transport system substrate-binding protein
MLKKGNLFKEAVLYIPDFGLAGGGDCAGVLRNARHKAAALLFLDFLTRPEQ